MENPQPSWPDVMLEASHLKKFNTATQQHVLRDTSTVDYVNSPTIAVHDVNGELFDFNGLPLEFELEIN